MNKDWQGAYLVSCQLVFSSRQSGATCINLSHIHSAETGLYWYRMAMKVSATFSKMIRMCVPSEPTLPMAMWAGWLFRWSERLSRRWRSSRGVLGCCCRVKRAPSTFLCWGSSGLLIGGSRNQSLNINYTTKFQLMWKIFFHILPPPPRHGT